MSVVNDSVAWLGGSDGWIGLTVDGAKTWNFFQVNGEEEQQFRSLYAFDEKKAVIANAGSPAIILVTENAGQEWKTVRKDNRPEAFYDGMDFWENERGIIYGDPIERKMSVISTENGGRNWEALPTEDCPTLLNGEASFAASGTGIRTYKDGLAMVSTGGLESRLWKSSDYGQTWQEINVPIIKGKNSTGIFSHHFKSENNGIIVGGDYTENDQMQDHIFVTSDGGKSWVKPEQPTRGYRETVEFIQDSTYMAVGPNGIDISNSDGRKWSALSDEKNFHVLRKARNGELILVAGADGKVGRIRKVN